MSKILLVFVIIATTVFRFTGVGYFVGCRVIFLSVGQGDSTLTQCDGKNFLVDAGPDDSALFKLDQYLLPWNRTLDLVVFTHPHSDHINGYADLLGKYEIKKIWVNLVDYKTNIWKEIVHADNVENVCAGSYDLSADVHVDVINPPCEKSSLLKNIEKANVNNASIVMRMQVEGTSILMMGDAEVPLEKYIMAGKNANLLGNAEILKAGHHCSNTSSSEAFLLLVKPQTIICSVGKDNKYGHPGKTTTARFNALGLKYLVMYEVGDVVFNMDSVK